MLALEATMNIFWASGSLSFDVPSRDERTVTTNQMLATGNRE